MPEVRLIDANALEQFYECGTDPYDTYADMTYIRAEHIENAPTIEPEMLLIPKEVSATDIDKFTEMIKGTSIQAYPNDAMFTTVRHGLWIDTPLPNSRFAKCSLCGFLQRTNGDDKTGKHLIHNAVYRYCAGCGARMDGGADNG